MQVLMRVMTIENLFPRNNQFHCFFKGSLTNIIWKGSISYQASFQILALMKPRTLRILACTVLVAMHCSLVPYSVDQATAKSSTCCYAFA